MWSRRQAIENSNYWGDPRVIEGMMNRAEGLDQAGLPNWSWIYEQVTECNEEWHPSLEGLEGEEYTAQWNKIAKSSKTEMAYFLDMLREKFPNIFGAIPSLESLLDAEELNFPHCQFPTKWAICDNCDGEGSHVNPSIDCGGITSDEWGEWDYEDRERYFSGAYDVTCKCCNGSGKVRVLADTDNDFIKWVSHMVEEHDRYEYEHAMEVAAERRFGC